MARTLSSSGSSGVGAGFAAHGPGGARSPEEAEEDGQGKRCQSARRAVIQQPVQPGLAHHRGLARELELPARVNSAGGVDGEAGSQRLTRLQRRLQRRRRRSSGAARRDHCA
jgi:hypothetical protein